MPMCAYPKIGYATTKLTAMMVRMKQGVLARLPLPPPLLPLHQEHVEASWTIVHRGITIAAAKQTTTSAYPKLGYAMARMTAVTIRMKKGVLLTPNATSA